ncbi:MAG TPA: adenylate/guanylate cyclase domain-containing protein [Candidatus Eisenbacteria bacterium]|nr:adenylate/guanylate cyclase domain-containing protein [Candidatus Eisenbacteria bacterium]
METKGTPRILAVDDNKQNLEILTKALSAANYEVITAADGPTALKLVQTGASDLVLLDVMMPGMSGYEVCEQIRANHETRLLPVVMLTALHDVSHRIRGIEAGADDFLTKPFNREELLTRVKSLLRIKTLYDQIEAKNRLLRTLFGRYLSEEVAADIVADPDRHLKLGGEKREVTVLFADLRGFTPLAERLDPQDAVEIINAYLTHVVDIVFEHKGTLDKFRGDGFMAFFGAPVWQEDHAASAVRCALALQRVLAHITFAKFPDLRLQMGIGINTGTVIAGNIGSERRTDYTVIGNAVNVAQRFESNAGPGQILITGSSYERVSDVVEVRALGLLRIVGKQDGVMAYDVLRWRAP